jgi:1,2-dihydroxy-3-keto-5-methylthiopentene dioxygenase
MASITFHNTDARITAPGAVADELNGRGLVYRFWNTDRLTGRLKEGDDLDAAEQKDLIGLYARELFDLKHDRGYVAEDVIVLSPTTPNLDTILAKFDKEHHHTDDEVRFVVDGGGIFTICQGDAVFDITVGPGDLFVVPAYTRHWFTLTDERRIKCIRIFKDNSGWTPVYESLMGG